MARKRRPIVLIAVALAIVMLAVAVSYRTWRPRNDPRIVTALPPLTRLIPRSEFVSRPAIDLPWFGGKRIQYPSLSAMPKGFKDDPEVSGILVWDDPKPTPGGPLSILPAGATAVTGTIFFNSGMWDDGEGNKLELLTENRLMGGRSSAKGTTYSALPYVYGSRPKKFKVSWLNFAAMFGAPAGAPPPVYTAEIELPPNHIPSPKVIPTDVQVGKMKVHFTPLPRVSPGFSQKYLVEVSGQKPATSISWKRCRAAIIPDSWPTI